MEALIQLENDCSIKKDEWGGSEEAHILSFYSKRGVTTIRIIFNDSSGADVAITNMTTLPNTQRGMGYGSKALQSLLRWALNNHLGDVRAVQVQKPSEPFWIRNGFIKLGNKTNDLQYRSTL